MRAAKPFVDSSRLPSNRAGLTRIRHSYFRHFFFFHLERVLTPHSCRFVSSSMLVTHVSPIRFPISTLSGMTPLCFLSSFCRPLYWWADSCIGCTGTAHPGIVAWDFSLLLFLVVFDTPFTGGMVVAFAAAQILPSPSLCQFHLSANVPID